MNLRLCSFGLLALASAALLRADTLHEPFNEIRPLNPGGRVKVDNTNGPIEIRTWNRNDVQIAGEKQASDADGLKDLQVVIDASPDSVVVRAEQENQGWRSLFHLGRTEMIRFTLMVPANARLDGIHTVNGTIDIAGVTGPVRASSVNGSIRLTGLGGAAQVTTVNGSVHAEFTSAQIRDPLSFRTVNGGISIQLPRSAAVETHTSTVNGHVSSDFPRARNDLSDRPIAIDAHTVNGAITVQAVPDKT